MRIEEDYCSFELAKVLKQKGFDEFTTSYYDVDTDDEDDRCCIRYWWQTVYSNSKRWIRNILVLPSKWLSNG